MLIDAFFRGSGGDRMVIIARRVSYAAVYAERHAIFLIPFWLQACLLLGPAACRLPT